ncbi:MAG: RDD family protein [Candidatus Omnitrophota bacterium]|nr:RDD family protein [Candidatus Omnitrophota bacterium]
MEFNKPGPNKRVCAYIIDYGLASTLGICLAILLETKMAAWTNCLFYMLLRDTFGGRSLGKLACGLKVIDVKKRPLKISQAIIRNIFIVLPVLPLVEYFVLLKNQQGRRIGDKAAKTMVIDLRPQIKDAVFFWFSLVFAVIFLALWLVLIMYIYKNRPLLLYGR